MRLPLPPAWRGLLRGSGMPWAVAGLVAAAAGAAWLTNPADAAGRVVGARSRLVGREPNQTGRALGLTAGMLTDRVQDPIEVLVRRAVVARAGTASPTYRAGAGDFFRPYLPSPPEVTWPMPTQNLRLLGAQQPFRGQPIQPTSGVSITAAEVLASQRGSTDA